MNDDSTPPPSAGAEAAEEALGPENTGTATLRGSVVSQDDTGKALQLKIGLYCPTVGSYWR